ncbi:MAG: endonuclease/exonuclease/phosphatase family protein [Bacteroidales bacterium]|nr:endonuclease/exonuclease/phosphatase family protein [Bacteroidales bacterium]
MARRRDKKSSDVFFKIILIICAVMLCISYISIFIDPAKLWIPMFFGLYYIPIFALNVLLLIIAVFRRKKSMLIPLIALVPSLFFADLFVKFGREEKVYQSDGIKVLTYNVGRFSAGVRGESADKTAAHIVDFIGDENADIVCLQEFCIKDTALIFNYFHQYPYHAQYYFKGESYCGNLTLSKYPILASGVIKFDKSTNLCIWSNMRTTDGIARVYNCHLESYSLSFTSMVKRLSKKGNFTDVFMGIHSKLKGTTQKRSAQVATLLNDVEECQYPSIICGDFNDTPISYAYHRIKRGAKDSFVEGGEGFSSTYSVLWPLLRIDYILLPDKYSADKHRITRIPFSDHYPVSTLIFFE